MEVVAITPELEQAWDAFVQSARNGHFMFERRFMTYHADRFTEASLVVLQKGKILGLLPANRRGDTICSHEGLTFGGLLVGGANTCQVQDILEACADALRRSGARRLIYKPMPWIYHRQPAQEDLYWLFRRNAQLLRRDVTSTIRTCKPGQVSTLRRRGAAKAQRAGLRYGRSLNFAGYWILLRDVLAQRHNVTPVHTVEEITRLSLDFPDNISLHVAEDLAGEILAGILIFQTSEVAHAQYIAVGPRGREIGALDGLVAHLLETFGPRVSYLDFGISNEGDGRALNAGLLGQKEGFGASAVVHDRYEVVLD